MIGVCRFISRDQINTLIEANTHTGYQPRAMNRKNAAAPLHHLHWADPDGYAQRGPRFGRAAVTPTATARCAVGVGPVVSADRVADDQ
jgi:hypothetical protein